MNKKIIIVSLMTLSFAQLYSAAQKRTRYQFGNIIRVLPQFLQKSFGETMPGVHNSRPLDPAAPKKADYKAFQNEDTGALALRLMAG